MKRFARFALIAVVVASLGGCRYADDASDTAFSQFKASSLLDKYTKFKDMYAALDAKRASINILKGKIASTEEQYKGVPRKDWVREDVQAINQWKGELDGVKASYNSLAAEYNAAMAKANVNFTNVGDLPKGATTPLPREVAPYIND